jgi:uncharacterized membrane protein
VELFYCRGITTNFRSLEVAIRVWEMSLVPSKKGFSVRVEVVPFLALLSALSGLLVRQAFDSAS